MSLCCLAVFILLLACGDKPTHPDTDKGTLVVLSDIDEAFVYIDEILTSWTTPAEIELDVKSYCVKVAKIGYVVDPESLIVSLQKDVIDTAFFELTASSDTAFLNITANYDYVSILIDGIPAEAFTPAFIPISSGGHEVVLEGWVFEGSYSQTVSTSSSETTDVAFDLEFGPRVLIEEFSHVNCTNCPGAAASVHQVVENFGDSVVSIEWHPQQSGGTDPFHVANPDIHDGRVTYYNFVGIPKVYVAGKPIVDPSSISAITSYVDNYISYANDASKIKLWGIAKSNGDVFIGALANGISVEGVIKIAVVEKHRTYSDPPGINGMTDFYNVPMEFYSYPVSGTIVLADGEATYIELIEIDIPPGGTPADYSYIVWFQRDMDGVYTEGEDILCSPGILNF